MSKLKPSGFNNIEDVEENSVIPEMDVWRAFEVQDALSEALAFSNKSEVVYKQSSKLDLTPSRNFRFSENFDGALRVCKGVHTSALPLCSSVSEALRR